MDPSLLPIPQDWPGRILTLVFGTVVGGTLYKLIELFVKKQTRKSEVAMSNVQAENIKVDVLAKYQEMLIQLQDRLNHVEAAADERERHCQEQIQFFQMSLTYHRQLLSAYVRRGHEFAGETGRLVLFIKNQEIDLARAAEKIKQIQNVAALPDGMAPELTDLIMLISPAALRIRTAEEITRAFPLPKAPDGIDGDLDSRFFNPPD